MSISSRKRSWHPRFLDPTRIGEQTPAFQDRSYTARSVAYRFLCRRSVDSGSLDWKGMALYGLCINRHLSFLFYRLLPETASVEWAGVPLTKGYSGSINIETRLRS